MERGEHNQIQNVLSQHQQLLRALGQRILALEAEVRILKMRDTITTEEFKELDELHEDSKAV